MFCPCIVYNIWFGKYMSQTSSQIIIDISSFGICQLCLRVIPIFLLEVYVLYLYVKQIIKIPNYNYDKIDLALFITSIACIFIDIFSAIIFGIGISNVQLVLKVIWTLVLYLIFLRFVFRVQVCTKYFVVTVMLLIFYYSIQIIFFGIVPVRYSLLFIYLLIGFCSIHQYILINQLLSNEKARQKQLKTSLYNRVMKDNQIQLLEYRKQYEHKILSPELKYHLYLRKSFCMVISITLFVVYFFIWNLEESRSSVGQIFVILVVQILPMLEYYFFACANQWLFQQKPKLQDEDSNLQQLIPKN